MSLLPHPPLGFKKQHHKNTNEFLKSQEFCKKNIDYYCKLLIFYIVANIFFTCSLNKGKSSSIILHTKGTEIW